MPSSFAALVDNTNFSGATWTPYASSNITVNLGTTQGWHEVWVGLRGRMETSQQTWQWLRVKLDTTPPQLVITNPVSTNISQPMIQLVGYCPEALTSFRYDLTNAAGLVTNELVLVTSEFYDTNTFEFTTNYFQAFDIGLTNGSNTITLYATDRAGNVTMTNLMFILDYSSDTNPPVINLHWPQDGTQISGSSFTWRGWVDDFTATLTVSMVDTNGVTNTVNAIVERNGDFWIENLPLADGTNTFTLTATDAAGNSSSTNINVVKSSVTFTMISMAAGDTTVYGTMDTSGYTIWVNGVQAAQDGNGYWTATNVPMFSMGNTTIYQARAIPNSDNGGNGSAGSSSSGNVGNPNSTIAIDVEADPDKPEGIYISSYSVTEHWKVVSPGNWDYTWDHTLNWQDGQGGQATGHDRGVNYVTNGVYTDYNFVDSWPATSWPQVLPLNMTEQWRDNLSGTNGTNVYNDAWPGLGNEHCDVNYRTNFGDIRITWTRKAQTKYSTTIPEAEQFD